LFSCGEAGLFYNALVQGFVAFEASKLLKNTVLQQVLFDSDSSLLFIFPANIICMLCAVIILIFLRKYFRPSSIVLFLSYVPVFIVSLLTAEFTDQTTRFPIYGKRNWFITPYYLLLFAFTVYVIVRLALDTKKIFHKNENNINRGKVRAGGTRPL
jgi:hypothetical protein